MHRAFHVAGWGYVAVCAALIYRSGAFRGAQATAPTRATTTAELAGEPNAAAPGSFAEAEQWFRRTRPYCNSVEVGVVQRQSPAPTSVPGAGFEAACFALAGRIDDARRRIDALPQGDRYKAAGIVFDVGHPVADAGDDLAAGPIMELVVDYWPNHYMALYHAGMAEYMLGQRDLSRRNLQEFLKYYHEHDGWTNNALEVLKRLDDPNAVPMKRPMEPPG
jgi:hypothetical protein